MKIGCSPTWSSIVKAASFLDRPFKYRVGNDEISVFYDNWLGDGPICDCMDYVHISDTQLLIRDVLVNGQWSWGKFYSIIPDEVKNKMTSLVMDDNSYDIIIWGQLKSGIFTAKSAYEWWIHEPANHSNFPGDWNWVWKLQTPENIKHFTWLILQNSLPTNFFRTKRHISFDPFCCRCGLEDESIIHLLRDCSEAREIWSHINMYADTDFFAMNGDTWFVTQLK